MRKKQVIGLNNQKVKNNVKTILQGMSRGDKYEMFSKAMAVVNRRIKSFTVADRISVGLEESKQIIKEIGEDILKTENLPEYKKQILDEFKEAKKNCRGLSNFINSLLAKYGSHVTKNKIKTEGIMV